MLEHLDDALRRGFGDFTTTRTQPEKIAETGAQRLDIKLSYRGKSWGTIQLEVAAAEGEAGREIDRVPGKPLDALGIEAPVDVPCVSIRYQIAQKLHACTEVPTDGRSNDRFRDLIDLLLLEDLVDAFLASPRHRAILLLDPAVRIGAAYVYGPSPLLSDASVDGPAAGIDLGQLSFPGTYRYWTVEIGY